MEINRHVITLAKLVEEIKEVDSHIKAPSALMSLKDMNTKKETKNSQKAILKYQDHSKKKNDY